MSVLKKQIKKSPSLHNFQKIIRYKLAILNIKNSDHLVDIHFKFLAKQGFQNIELFKKLFQNSNPHSLNIFETGSSANWGANSSLLFDAYVKIFGGKFVTVDLRNTANKYLNNRFSKFSKSYVDDSINFIKNTNQDFLKRLDVVYLDSYDLDINDPYPSMEHGLKEFLEIDKYISKDCLVAVDDTPNEEAYNKYLKWQSKSNEDTLPLNLIPGKGSLILVHQVMKNYELIYQYYGIILRKK